jgi:hypothetical protein
MDAMDCLSRADRLFKLALSFLETALHRLPKNIDEDLSTESMLRGTPAPRQSVSAAEGLAT